MRNSLLVAFVTVSTFLSGCATTGNPDPLRQAQKVAAYVETTAEAAVNNTVDKYPELRAYYKATVQLIDLLLQNKDYDPEKLVKAVQEMKINEVKSEKFGKNMASVLKVYRVEVADRITAKLDQNVYVRPILEGLRDGLKAGLE